MKYELELEPAKLDENGKEVRPARVVVLKELSARDFEQMLKTMSEKEREDSWDMVQNGLRRSIVSDGGKPLDYTKLVGDQLADRYTTKQILMLRHAWQELHSVNEEDLLRVRVMRAVAD